MTVPTPRTYVAGELETATIINGDVRDTFIFLLNPPHVHTYRSANKSTTSGSWVLYDFNTEGYDWSVTAMHDTATNNSRLIAPEPGIYTCAVQARWAINATGTRNWQVKKNAGGVEANGTLIALQLQNAISGTAMVFGSAFDVQLAASDYLELFTFQNSGGALDVEAGSGATFMTLRWTSKL